MDGREARARPLRASTSGAPALAARLGAWLDAHPAVAALFLYGVALAVRTLYLPALADPRTARAPFMDEALYRDEAWNIVRGAPAASDAYFMTPLYPWFLSLVFRTVGDAGAAPYAVQMLLGAAAAPLVWLVGRQALHPLWGFAAGLAVATFAPLAFFESLYLVEWLILLAMLGAFAIAVAAPPRLVWAACAGVCTGIAVLGRGTALFVLPLLVAWYWTRRGVVTRTGAARCALACALGCAAVLSPLAIRNVRHAERPLLLTANLGFNLWVGNGTDANGIFVRTPGLDLQQDPLTLRYVQRHLRRPVTASETSVWWLVRTRNWVERHPGRTLRLFLWKLLLFWNRQSIPQVEGFEAMAATTPLVRPPFWRSLLFLPLALSASLAILLGSLRRDPGAPDAARRSVQRLLAAWAWLYAAAVSVFFITDRYRVPLVPCLILLAAVGLQTLVAWVRPEHRLRLAMALAALCAAFFVTSPGRIGVDRRSMERDLEIHAALRAAEGERYDVALTHFERARRLDPQDADVLDGRARLLARAGRDPESMQAFRELLAVHPDDSRGWYNFGNAHRRAGRDSAALAAYQRSLALEPEREQAWNQLGETYRTLGDTARAADAYRSALALAPGYEQALNNLAALRAQQGEAAAAEAGFRAAARANPRYVPALVNLALLLGDENPEARVLWRQVLALDPRNRTARDKLGRAETPTPANLPP